MNERPVVHRALAIRSQLDPVLHHLAPMGLAGSVGTCLVIDLDPVAPTYGGDTLASLRDRGLSESDLQVVEGGVALVGNGGVEYHEVSGLIDQLADRWPHTVFRAGSQTPPVPLVDIEPAYPAPLDADTNDNLVIQRLFTGQSGNGGVVSLPRLRRGQIHAMLRGEMEPRWRWVRAWRPVWSLPWA